MQPASPPPRLGSIKGFAFAEFVNWYGERWGREAVAVALARAESRYAVQFDLDRPGYGILASQWYHAEIVHTILDELMQKHSAAEIASMIPQAAEDIMGKMLRGIYRAIFAMCVTPERYLRHVEKIWRLQYDNGRPTILAPRANEHRITYVDWHSHHPIICHLNMAASRPIYAAMGCKEPHYKRVGCISTGATRCEVHVVWKWEGP